MEKKREYLKAQEIKADPDTSGKMYQEVDRIKPGGMYHQGS
jgi:hypothetical protein